MTAPVFDIHRILKVLHIQAAKGDSVRVRIPARAPAGTPLAVDLAGGGEEVVAFDHAIVATGSRPLGAQEVADARDRQTLTLAGRWETADAVSNSLQEQETYDLAADYWQTYAARARAVTPEQATASAKKMLDPGKMVWVVVGDRTKIEASLRELGLGEIRYLDSDGRPLGAGK